MEFTDVAWGVLSIGAGMFILEDQGATSRFLIALVIGAILGVLLFALVRLGVHIAGAILGLVLAVVVGGFVEILGPSPSDVLMTILVFAGIAGGGFLGQRIGRFVVLFATAVAGAFMIVDGLHTWYSEPLDFAGKISAETLGTGVAMSVFVVLVGMSVLGQRNAQQLRQRVLN